MMTAKRLTLRLAGSALMLAALFAPAAPQTVISPADADSAAARATPEVRLRKLHLVRPDLIPYPVAYEVYC
jgi:hypothetical protein